jgi:S-adenosyl-L-methionine hydrolase (adenosine-forming)
MPTGGARRRAPIALITDFGHRDHYVGVVKAVLASLAAGATVIDLTHGIPPQQIGAGALALRESWHFFPRRTIFLGVVDPGVGTSRLPIAIETRAGVRFVGPDNGLLSLAAEAAGIKSIVSLDSPRFRLPRVSTTFHARDVFAPAAAALWQGVRLSELGRRREAIVGLNLSEGLEQRARELKGTVVYVDSFGNLITNIGRADFSRFASRFRGVRLSVTIKRHAGIEVRETYGDAPPGGALATFGSFEMMEVAVRDGSAADRFGAGVGTRVAVRARGSSTADHARSSMPAKLK